MARKIRLGPASQPWPSSSLDGTIRLTHGVECNHSVTLDWNFNGGRMASPRRIVLDWLKGHPSEWQTFIANRVSLINTAFPDATWRHIKSSDNAADCADRALAQLAEFKLWWNDPSWILQPRNEWSTADQARTTSESLQSFLDREENTRTEII